MNPKPVSACELNAEQFNKSCRCIALNRHVLRTELAGICDSPDLYKMLIEERPGLFAESAVFLNSDVYTRQLQIIAALERVIAMPAYQQQVLAQAPTSAWFAPKAHGVFLGYDFHLSAAGPKLIEINSNAGGAMINAKLVRAQNACCGMVNCQQPGRLPTTSAEPEQLFMAMFREEWRLERGAAALRSIAIVDEQPEQQYLLPEFILFKQLFAQHGITAIICDPAELQYHDGGLWCGELQIDMVYNRLTDFSLDEDQHSALRTAYLQNAVVLTPHPRNHALYADKTNLALFTDESFLTGIGVDATTRATLLAGVAHTQRVTKPAADFFWAQRKQLFFKPARGYGSKAAYRGDKLTRSVFDDIIAGDYVAQSLVKPSSRQLEVAEQIVDLKMDFRHYVYQGQTQLICARLYQGQTTNFRTPGGGFAQVVVVA